MGDVCSLVLGGHVNGYSIVKELWEQKTGPIILFDSGRSIARYSNKILKSARIDQTQETLLKEINRLHEDYDFIVIYPTDDLQVENLFAIKEEISNFCFLPFNRDTVVRCSDKYFQYETCKRVGIPFPQTINAKKISDLDDVDGLRFPLLIKPSTRKDLTQKVFRTLYIESPESFEKKRDKLDAFLQSGVEFVVSEYIPGDDTNIYAYTCFRSYEGEILNEWSGKKLTQYPDDYGVFCSASNDAPDEVKEQGRKLVQAFDAFGIVEPEFKYDYRDGKYKLMETNLRSMMWHRTGSISGVKLHETQYLYSTGNQTVNYEQDKSKSIHFVLMLHEIPNLIARKGYLKHFKYNVFSGQKRVWAIYEKGDVKPFLFSLLVLTKMCGEACLRRLKLR